MSTGVAITGIGQSAIGRRLGRSPLSLTVEAARAAAADAGIELADIDGVSAWPGRHESGPGFSGVGVFEVQDVLGLSLRWFSGGSETAGQLGAVINAVAAVRAGFADHVLCFRTVWEATAQGTGRRGASLFGPPRVDGWAQWLTPFGSLSAANWCAMLATRYFHENGGDRSQLGALAVQQRSNATRNPAAVYRDPLTLADYLGARMISSPLCLFDCDVPVDGSTAIIVSRADALPDPRRSVAIERVSSALSGRPSWDQWQSTGALLPHVVGRELWSRTDLRPQDVDVAELYDGFTILTLVWLEGLGLAPAGEAGRFVSTEGTIGLDGTLPLNTGGGQLSAGRLHGFGHLHEAVVQLRGEGAGRQVPGTPRVAVAAAGGGNLGGAILLYRG